MILFVILWTLCSLALWYLATTLWGRGAWWRASLLAAASIVGGAVLTFLFLVYVMFPRPY